MAKLSRRHRGKATGRIIAEYAYMWPRNVFYLKKHAQLLPSLRDRLNHPGVYVLYREDHPYYIGKTSGKLFNRILTHSHESGGRYYRFWNYFSAFVVRDRKRIGEVEGILIAASPTANNARPRIKRIRLPREVALYLKKIRDIKMD